MNQKGMTLVETVIYIGLAALVLVSFISFSLLVAGLESKTYAWVETAGTSALIIDRLSREIKLAEAVVSPVPGTATSTLVLNTASGTKTILAAGGILKIKLNGEEIGALNSQQAPVADLVFRNLSGARGPANIDFSFTLGEQTETSPEFRARQTVYTAVSLRK